MLRQYKKTFSSRHRDGSEMYPGVWIVTEALICGAWMQISCVPDAEQ